MGVTVCSRCKTSQMQTVLLVEGERGRIAIERLAERRNQDLMDARVVSLGGVTNASKAMAKFGPRGEDLRMVGLCDARRGALHPRWARASGARTRALPRCHGGSGFLRLSSASPTLRTSSSGCSAFLRNHRGQKSSVRQGPCRRTRPGRRATSARCPPRLRGSGRLRNPHRVPRRIAERTVARPALIDRLLQHLGTRRPCALECDINVVR